jgi:hypothetical protein
MQCLFPQLKSSFTVYESLLLLHFSLHSVCTSNAWNMASVFFSIGVTAKGESHPGRTNSGHANNDVKPCIGTFEIKTPKRRKERLPLSDTGWGRTPERVAKKRTNNTMERIPLQLEQQSDDQAGVLESTFNPNAAADVQNSASSPAPASVTAFAALRFEKFNEASGYASVRDAAFLSCLQNHRQ